MKKQFSTQIKTSSATTSSPWNKLHNTYKKAQSVVTSKRTCKEKVKLLKYEKSTKKLNPEGLSFPDNLMAVLGWSRAKA